MSFDTCKESGNHYHNQYKEHFHPLKIYFCSLPNQFPSPSPSNHGRAFSCLNFGFSRFSHSVVIQ